jgi:hypothetical protein
VTTLPNMSIVDQLIANPGVYLGVGWDPSGERGQSQGQAARIVVTPLPAGAGVTVDYESFDVTNPERVRPHIEHVIIGRLHGGGAILVSGHAHADTVAVLRETSPGEFNMGNEPAAFPMAISISVPEPGRLVYVWSYGAPGQEPEPRDRAEVSRQ